MDAALDDTDGQTEAKEGKVNGKAEDEDDPFNFDEELSSSAGSRGKKPQPQPQPQPQPRTVSPPAFKPSGKAKAVTPPKDRKGQQPTKGKPKETANEPVHKAATKEVQLSVAAEDEDKEEESEQDDVADDAQDDGAGDSGADDEKSDVRPAAPTTKKTTPPKNGRRAAAADESKAFELPARPTRATRASVAEQATAIEKPPGRGQPREAPTVPAAITPTSARAQRKSALKALAAESPQKPRASKRKTSPSASVTTVPVETPAAPRRQATEGVGHPSPLCLPLRPVRLQAAPRAQIL